MVSDHCKADWKDKAEYKTVWQKEYDQVIQTYVKKVQSFTEKFLETPAGKALQNSVEASKKRRTIRPMIDESTLASFHGEKGVQLEVNEIYEFFSLLSDVTETEIFEFTVR